MTQLVLLLTNILISEWIHILDFQPNQHFAILSENKNLLPGMMTGQLSSDKTTLYRTLAP